MAAIKNGRKPNVTPKAAEIKVTESVEENVIKEENVEVETSDVKEPTIENTVTINEDLPDNDFKDKMVKVRLRENHRCNIGGAVYDLKKGEVSLVPEFVKSILAKADLLQSL